MQKPIIVELKYIIYYKLKARLENINSDENDYKLAI